MTRTVAAVDVIFAYAVIRAVVDPAPAQPTLPAMALVVGAALMLGAMLGTGWVIGAWLDLREHRQPPKEWYSDPLVRAKDITVRLDGDTAQWLTYVLPVLAGLCLAVVSMLS